MKTDDLASSGVSVGRDRVGPKTLLSLYQKGWEQGRESLSEHMSPLTWMLVMREERKKTEPGIVGHPADVRRTDAHSATISLRLRRT